jgi:hypothetical protein
MTKGRIEYFSKPERERETIPKLSLIYNLCDNSQEDKTWIRGNSEMVLNASRLMIADLLESERTAISIDCQTKMAKLI